MLEKEDTNILLKQSDIKLPEGLPENDGILMFLWPSGSENGPAMTWDKMTNQRMGEALQILLYHLLRTDVQNKDIVLSVLNYTVERITQEN